MGAARLRMALDQLFVMVCAPERVPLERDEHGNAIHQEPLAFFECVACAEIDHTEFEDEVLPPGFTETPWGIFCDECSDILAKKS